MSRRRTKTLLGLLCDRLAEQCWDTGREDLVYAVALIRELGQDSPKLSGARLRILEILEADDHLVEVSVGLERYCAQRRMLAEMPALGGVQ
ncbi:hypothetical protein IHQ68_10145 [Chelatococcus sambhunathii]|uniref:Uncharacterized protein n=1 Tax=Chelatococcus sambhunathii TaxID=363953 RepID=A0ABU1DFR7_9HYPH|nr:hypothetical protein [Chelatococcus sambhunathii]MDR4306978.1 hypothetical protein [Chelatococcus sambhunathii]